MVVIMYRTISAIACHHSALSERVKALGSQLGLAAVQKRKDLPKEVSSTPPERARLDQQL